MLKLRFRNFQCFVFWQKYQKAIVSVPVISTLPVVVIAAVVRPDVTSTVPLPLGDKTRFAFEVTGAFWCS